MHVFETGLCVSEVANGFFSDIDDGRDFAVVCAPRIYFVQNESGDDGVASRIFQSAHVCLSALPYAVHVRRHRFHVGAVRGYGDIFPRHYAAAIGLYRRGLSDFPKKTIGGAVSYLHDCEHLRKLRFFRVPSRIPPAGHQCRWCSAICILRP